MTASAPMQDIHGCEDPWGNLNPSEYFLFITVSTFLVLFGGVMSGLQQGIMQLDESQLVGLEREGGRGAWKAKWLLPLARRKHFTLVTLLISNAIAMEALPIFLDALAPKYFAILMSVTLVVFFGEIIPQGMCLRYPTELSANFAWLVYFLMVMLSPVAYPIAWILDTMLGKESHHLFSRAGLWELAQLHSKDRNNGAPLEEDEVNIISGALELCERQVKEVMTGLERVYLLNLEDTLNDRMLREILNYGYSRLPVYQGERSNIIGYILVKQLLRVKYPIAIQKLQLTPIEVVPSTMSLYDVLRQLRLCRKHIAIVVNDFPADQGSSSRPATEYTFVLNREAIGIVTMVDVLETLLKDTIESERDVLIPLNHSLDDQLGRLDGLRERMERIACTQTFHGNGNNNNNNNNKFDEPNERTSLVLRQA